MKVHPSDTKAAMVPPAREVRILFEHPLGKWKKITKIVHYKMPDGGFAVMLPYHRARAGYLFKAKISDRISGMIELPPPRIVATYTASNRVKLTFHSDGFTQFSGPKIRSGIDKTTGKIKGLGIMARPFSSPAWSGPTFAIVAWGLDDFDSCTPGKNDIKFSIIELARNGLLSESSVQVYLEGYIVSLRQKRQIFGEFPDFRYFGKFYNPITRSFDRKLVRAIALNHPEAALMIDAFRIPRGFPSPSGYSVTSPRDYDDYGMYAFYPPLPGVSTTKTLDYEV